MTRTLEIVNLSNGDGEDYEIIADAPVALYGHPGTVTMQHGGGMAILKPGESCGVGVYEHQDEDGNITDAMDCVSVRAVRRMKGTIVDGEGSTPVDAAFMMNGKQVTPFMTVGFR